jgi:hypothetical protein
LVAAAANLSFAVELYIKTLLAVLRIDVPTGHHLGKLYASVPQAVRDEIEMSYATWRRRYGGPASITIAKGPLTPPRWEDGRSESYNLGAVLDRSGDIFSSWRYIYEFTHPGHGGYQFHRFEYWLLLAACDVIHVAILDRLEGSPTDRDG